MCMCDKNNARVQVFDSNLKFVQSFGTNSDGPGQLKGPRDIDFETQGFMSLMLTKARSRCSVRMASMARHDDHASSSRSRDTVDTPPTSTDPQVHTQVLVHVEYDIRNVVEC